MKPSFRSCGCLFLVLLFALFAISREGQGVLSFIWTFLTLVFEAIGMHAENALGSRR